MNRRFSFFLALALAFVSISPQARGASGINKTAGTSVLTLQTVATGVVVVSSAVDVSTKLAATVWIHFGRQATTALTLPTFFRVEGSAKASGDGYWFPLAQFTSLIAAVADEAVNGTCNASQNVIGMAATAGFVVGDIVFVSNATFGNSEWGRIKTVTTNTSVTLEDNLTNACTGGTVYASGEMYSASIDLTAVTRLRVVAGGQTAQTVAVEALMTTGDSVQ